jgi:Arc/MetJ family transcription regulator
MHIMCIIVHMRTTLNIDSDLLREAGKLTGISEKTSLVRLGLKALVEREAAKRLAALGGTEKSLMQIPRRRIKKIA